MDELKEIFMLNGSLIFRHMVTIGTAYLISLPIAWDRDKAAKSAGLRTFPIVAIATCGFTLLAVEVLPIEEVGKVIAGIVTGIGFIGGGAILKKSNGTTGTATAASLWNTGAIGVAVSFGRIEIAITLSIINFITLRFLTHLKSEEPD